MKLSVSTNGRRGGRLACEVESGSMLLGRIRETNGCLEPLSIALHPNTASSSSRLPSNKGHPDTFEQRSRLGCSRASCADASGGTTPSSLKAMILTPPTPTTPSVS